MRKRSALLLLGLAALVVPAFAMSAHAQQCPPGATTCVDTNGRVIIAPPPLPTPTVRIDPQIDARARAEAEARARADYEARLRLDAEMKRVLTWQAYLTWQARVRVEVEAQAALKLEAAARLQAERARDPYVGMMLPQLGRSPDAPISYPRVELGILLDVRGGLHRPELSLVRGLLHDAAPSLRRVMGARSSTRRSCSRATGASTSTPSACTRRSRTASRTGAAT